MKIPKERVKVRIICQDGSLLLGYIYIPEGLRILDFLNDKEEKFIIVTDCFFQNIAEVHSFKLINELTKKRGAIFLNKDAIKWIEELKDEKGL